ncbi:MAG: PilZ protein [Rhodocyclales bacterium]|nr:PilZ protein [Rhodocyclales bacterium]MDB5888960.1 PilZ protein [Rhodocyclales bacterium]
MSQYEYRERRQRQRFLAQRAGTTFFWAAFNGQRVPLLDLSLEGFSIAASAPPTSDEAFAFELRLEGIPDKIKGQAQQMNFVPGEPHGQIGCRFVSFEGEGAMRLHEWLTIHVIAGATVRITVKEAEKIVEGPSLI